MGSVVASRGCVLVRVRGSVFPAECVRVAEDLMLLPRCGTVSRALSRLRPPCTAQLALQTEQSDVQLALRHAHVM
jgi:hypothetical protein